MVWEGLRLKLVGYAFDIMGTMNVDRGAGQALGHNSNASNDTARTSLSAGNRIGRLDWSRLIRCTLVTKVAWFENCAPTKNGELKQRISNRPRSILPESQRQVRATSIASSHIRGERQWHEFCIGHGQSQWCLIMFSRASVGAL